MNRKPEDLPRLAGGSEALVIAALTAMVLIALAAFWAIGTEAYRTWRHETTLAGTPPDQATVPSGTPVS